MTTDFTWLSQEAQKIHDIFEGLFYMLSTCILLFGILLEYFKLPLSGKANFGSLAVRTLLATLLLVAYPDIINAIADVSDGLAEKIGGLNTLDHITGASKEVLNAYSFSWSNMGDSLLWVITYFIYSVLYLTVFIFDAIVIYGWCLLYIFSPLLILMFILPQTAGATFLLFRSHVELASYKIVWSVLGTLLWSSALNNLSNSESNPNFFVALGFMVLIAFSIIFTPKIVGALINSGIAGASSQIGAIGFGALSAGAIGPAGLSTLMKKPVTTPLNQGFKMSKLGFSKAQSTVQKKYSNFKTKSRKPVYHKNVIPIDKYKKPKNDPNDKPPGGAA